MALFVSVYYGDVETSVGSTSAILATYDNQSHFFWDNWTVDTGTFYWRAKVATNSGMSTGVVYSGSRTQDNYIGITPGSAFDQVPNLQITGLSPSTVYYYILQYSYDDVTYYDGFSLNGGGAPGTFTTTASATPPSADFTVDTTLGPATLVVTGTDLSSGTPSDWEWRTSGNTAYSYNTATPTFFMTTPGTYTVTLTVTNADGSDSTVKSNLITVLTGVPYPSWTQNTTTGTRPLTVTFTGTATFPPSQPPTGWAWQLPDGVGTSPSTLRVLTKTYSVPGTYSAVLTATNIKGASSTSLTNAVTVKPISVAATFTANPTTGAVPLSVQFVGYPTGDTTGVLWDFGDGSSTTETNPQHTYYVTTATPTYTVYGTTAAGGAAVSVSTVTQGFNFIDGDTYLQFLQDLQRALLLNADITTVCNDFQTWGGVNTVLKQIYSRICRLQLETGLLRKTSTTISGSGGVLTLPADLIEIRSIYVDGKRLERVDARMADLAQPDWMTDTSGDFLGWYTNPANHLELHLVPAKNPDSTFEVYYVYAPTEPVVPQDCYTSWTDFPFPFVYWWVIKYGVLADLLQQEGDMYDIERAKICEQLWKEGVELIKLSMDGK